MNCYFLIHFHVLPIIAQVIIYLISVHFIAFNQKNVSSGYHIQYDKFREAHFNFKYRA